MQDYFSTTAAEQGQPVLDLLSALGCFPDHERTTSIKDRFWLLCPLPGHNDTRPSFSVSADGCQWTCWPCGQVLQGPRKLRELLTSAPVAPSVKTPKRSKPKQSKAESLQGATLQALSLAKGLPVEHLQSMGWADTKYAGVPAVAIPYPNGVRYRVGITTKDRFRWKKGSKPSLYGLDAIDQIRETGWALLVEGETDVAAARMMGIPALGIPGATLWKPAWAKHLEGIEVFVWQEPGQAGAKFAEKIAGSIEPLYVIEAPTGIKDLVELLDQTGSPEAARDMLEDLREDAILSPFRPEPISFSEDSVTEPIIDIPSIEDYDNDAVRQLIGSGVSPIFRRGQWGAEGFVSFTVRGGNRSYHKGDKQKRKEPGQRNKPALWEWARTTFPIPTSVKPLIGSRLMHCESKQKMAIVDMFSNSWRNPANAAYNRQKMLFNLLPKLNQGHVYGLQVASDDWDSKKRKAIAKAINREDAEWIWFDNRLRRGQVQCFTNTPLGPEWSEVLDVEGALVEGIASLEAGYTQEGVRPHLHGGSRGWSAHALASPDKSESQWECLALSRNPTDFTMSEVTAVVAGHPVEITSRFWRGQSGSTLIISRISREDAVEFAVGLGYSLTKKATSSLAGTISEE